MSDPWTTSPNRQQGPSIAWLFANATPPDDAAIRRAGLFATSLAIRQGWTPAVLADVLGALGVTK